MVFQKKRVSECRRCGQAFCRIQAKKLSAEVDRKLNVLNMVLSLIRRGVDIWWRVDMRVQAKDQGFQAGRRGIDSRNIGDNGPICQLTTPHQRPAILTVQHGDLLHRSTPKHGTQLHERFDIVARIEDRELLRQDR